MQTSAACAPPSRISSQTQDVSGSRRPGMQQALHLKQLGDWVVRCMLVTCEARGLQGAVQAQEESALPAHNTPEGTPARARVPEDAVPASAPPMQERVCGPNPSPAPRPSRSPASTPGSQGRRRGARATSNPNPNPTDAPPAAPTAGPNFVTALASFVSGRLQQDGDMGRGAECGDPNPRPDSESAGAPLLPPNVLADTTRPNHLAAPAAASAKAARKAGATVTWASPPVADRDPNPVPNVGLDQVGAARAEDEESGWVPDSVPAGTGSGGGGGGSGAASDVSALANGRGQVGAAGRTPHPAGCQVRPTRAYYNTAVWVGTCVRSAAALQGAKRAPRSTAKCGDDSECTLCMPTSGVTVRVP